MIARRRRPSARPPASPAPPAPATTSPAVEPPVEAGPAGRRLLPFAVVSQSPCDGCEAWCCANLSLPEFPAPDLEGLDWARYLLNFEGMRILLTKSGRWIPYWRQACRYFDRESHLCAVHGTDLQPHTCVSYDPFTCYYRKTFPAQENDEHLWLDRRRLEAILTGVQVDERRAVVLPPFEVLREVLDTVPLLPLPELPELRDPPEAAPRTSGEDAGERRDGLRLGDRAVQTPCDGCAAYCCTRLDVPVGVPTDATLVEYLRYALGFPGVELIVRDAGWSLAMPATCRHLDGGRCGVYGKDERPFRCQYYDAWTCAYRDTFGPGPGGDVRLRYEDLPVLLTRCEFDDRGQLLRAPAAAELAAALGSGE